MATPPFLPDESKPADGDVVSQYPAVERTFRDIIEDWLLVDHDTAGEHAQVTLPELGADPTNVANTGFLYTKDDTTDTELFYEDDSGNVVQITKDGEVNKETFPATTSMLFYQSAAPTGWTKDVASTLNSHALQVVTSSAWSGGSKGATQFNSVFGAGKVVGGTAISAAQMPVHSHVIQARINATLGTNAEAMRASTSGSASDFSTDNAGSGDPHNHTLSLDLNYINVIRATKD